MKKNKAMKAVSLTLGAVMCMGTLAVFAGCTDNTGDRALVVMTEALNGLFNPFFSTAGTDMDVVGMTQISMLGTDEEGNPAWGNDEAVVTLDYKYEEVGGNTNYYFVLKNGIQFSDGTPLTMNDVLFNMYVYLDPTYSGSSTMYSTDIVGLQQYRTQQNSQDDTLDENLTREATTRATNRRTELVQLFEATGRMGGSTGTSYYATEEAMRAAIENWTTSVGYKNAIAVDGNINEEEARAQLLQDYLDTLEEFRLELENDYAGAADAYTEEPYSTAPDNAFSDPILCFMYAEGFVTLEYEVTSEGTNRNQIVRVIKNYPNTITTQEAAIDYAYESLTTSSLNTILNYWATGTTMLNEYISRAKDVILHEQLGSEDELIYKNISGIVSLGHSTEEGSIEIDGTTYQIAHEHNADGTPANENEYDVLRITINGVDPKAVYNFGFTVAPYHYYSDPDEYPIDIANDQFGVEWGSFDFMSNVLQGTNDNGVEKNRLPMGAGPYAASDADHGDNPTANGFFFDNIVYYKANEHFLMGAPKIQYFCYQVVSSSNALGNLRSGQVHFVEPQFTRENSELITQYASEGIRSVATWQLGYGYIGVNARFVPNRYLRMAIMAAMDTSLALQYYDAGTAVNIGWPMSAVSWAYPRTAAGYDASNPVANMDNNNGKDYLLYTTREAARTKILDYMAQAQVSAGDSQLTLTFTIAGSSMTEHPAYNTFIGAMQLLNECGWDITVQADTNALVKLASGSLTVWAAAWGSTIDPDMYQVYHKDSTATSVLNWGYREILSNRATYSYEYNIVDELSVLIEDAREINDRATRSDLYEQAMSLVLDLAVEMPLYQRQTLYAYNANVIDESTFPETINSYTSPLSRIWEIDFVD